MAGEMLRRVGPGQIRARLEELVVADLLGPAGGPEEEVAEDRVTERYIVGMLAPRHTASVPEEADALALGGGPPTEEGEPEPDAPPNPTMFPSAYGLTFTVDGATGSLAVTARWGRYERQRSALAAEGEAPRRVWKRLECGGAVDVPLAEGDLAPQAPDPEQPDVLVEGRARRLGAGRGDWIVTLFLVNRQTEPRRLRDEAWLFQVELAVTVPGGAAVFRARSDGRPVPLDSPAPAWPRGTEVCWRSALSAASSFSTSCDYPRRAMTRRTYAAVMTAGSSSTRAWIQPPSTVS